MGRGGYHWVQMGVSAVAMCMAMPACAQSAERQQYDSYGDSITLRFGDVVIPQLEMAEPLKLECQHFAECVLSGRTPLSDGRDGLRVVQVLEAAQASLGQNGIPVELT